MIDDVIDFVKDIVSQDGVHIVAHVCESVLKMESTDGYIPERRTPVSDKMFQKMPTLAEKQQTARRAAALDKEFWDTQL
jgi:hypothetical protein